MPAKSTKNNKKKISQHGGEKHINVIHKNGSEISFPNGFPALLANGDYNIVHAYDPEEITKNNILGNLHQLENLVTVTYPFVEENKTNNHNRLIRDNPLYRIYINNKDDMIDLIHWLKNNN
jgi:hypothetical protein